MKNLTVITSNNATMNRIDTLNTFSDLANKYLDKGNKEKAVYYMLQFLRNYPKPNATDIKRIGEIDMVVMIATRTLSQMTYAEFIKAYPIEDKLIVSQKQVDSIVKTVSDKYSNDIIDMDIVYLIANYPNSDIKFLNTVTNFINNIICSE